MSKTILPANLSRSVLVWDNENPEKIKTREVKNLGWLLRHWQTVTGFTVSEPPREWNEWDGKSQRSNWDCILRADFKLDDEPTYYATTFADRNVLWSWLQRPVFFGQNVNWFGVDYTITKGAKQP